MSEKDKAVFGEGSVSRISDELSKLFIVVIICSIVHYIQSLLLFLYNKSLKFYCSFIVIEIKLPYLYGDIDLKSYCSALSDRTCLFSSLDIFRLGQVSGVGFF